MSLSENRMLVVAHETHSINGPVCLLSAGMPVRLLHRPAFAEATARKSDEGVPLHAATDSDVSFANAARHGGQAVAAPTERDRRTSPPSM